MDKANVLSVQSVRCPGPLERARAGGDSDSGDPVGKGGPAGKCIGPAGRPSQHGEVVDLQRVGQRGDVARPVAEATARSNRRTADSGAVGRDGANPQPPGHGIGVQPAAGRLR